MSDIHLFEHGKTRFFGKPIMRHWPPHAVLYNEFQAQRIDKRLRKFSNVITEDISVPICVGCGSDYDPPRFAQSACEQCGLKMYVYTPDREGFAFREYWVWRDGPEAVPC